MKDEKVYLLNILECIEKIEKYTGLGKEDFLKSDLIQDAVMWNLEIIEKQQKKFLLY